MSVASFPTMYNEIAVWFIASITLSAHTYTSAHIDINFIDRTHREREWAGLITRSHLKYRNRVSLELYGYVSKRA